MVNLFSVSYKAISIGGEKGDKYAIFKNFHFVPLGKNVVICDINNKSLIEISY